MEARGAKWWGWGFDDVSVPLESRPALHGYLRRTLELRDGDPFPVPAPESIPLPRSRFSEEDLAEFRRLVGEEGVAAGHGDRLSHAFGKSYKDLVRLRLGRVPTAPDAVLFPEAEEDVVRILEFAQGRDVAIVPFGGGTSVVGGVEVADPSRPHVTLDLRRMRRVLEVDPVSLTATVQAGIRGVLLEEELATHGLTLGHFPQSFEFSTLGGWIATRSVGSLSNLYGTIDALLAGVRLVAPAGTLDLRSRPRHAMGSDLLPAVVGSEGALGVVTQATLRLRHAPQAREFESLLFRGFGEGLEALRGMAQAGVPPAMAYLRDEDETRLVLESAGGAKGIGAGLLRIRGAHLEGGSLLLLGFEGPAAVVRSTAEHARTFARGGAPLGGSPAEAWWRDRYLTPYLRDSLIDHRIMVDSVETATVWSNVERLHRAAREAILNGIWGTGVQGLVGCHVSHVYTEGASLYFTWFARQKRGEEVGQYEAVKKAVTRGILDAGGNLSHHHGIGLEHAAYYREAIGDGAWRVLRELKRTLDPKGIMNPGKLFPVAR